MRTACAGVVLLATPLAAIAADLHLRFARLTLAEGRVDVEQAATGERLEAERNLPIGQGFWVETANGRAEIELDEGSLVRLGAGSLMELSDLTRLSTGQRISLVSLERGTLYATAEPAGLDAFVVVAPGMEITFTSGARIRVQAGDETSTVAVMEGRVRFTSRAAELDLREGQSAQVSPQSIERFQFFREVARAELDSWSEQRDKESDERDAGAKLAQFAFGLGELDSHGKWIDHSSLGKLWQPRSPEGWTPFRTGRWRWYEGVGFTWISTEPWGWLPYHYGRWTNLPPSGWVWAPGPQETASSHFDPGAVYWLRTGNFVGWGPLAPGETWRADVAPSLYSVPNTTFAAYEAAARVIDPARAPRLPQDPLRASQFVVGLPSPPPQPVSVNAARRRTRVGTTRIVPINPDQAFSAAVPASSGVRIIGAEPPAIEPSAAPPPPAQSYYYPEPALPPPAPAETIYAPAPAPEVVVIDRDRPRRDHSDRGGRRHDPPPGIRSGPAPAPQPKPAAAPPPPPKAAPEVVSKGALVTSSESSDKGKQLQNAESGQKSGLKK